MQSDEFASTFEQVITNGSRWFVGLCVAAMVAIIWVSIFYRYVLVDPLSWTEQAAKFIMIYGTMVASSLAVRSGAHIAMDIIVIALPKSVARVLFWVGSLLSGIFLLFVIFYGVQFAYKSREFQELVLGNMSMAIPYSAIPVGGLLMLIQLYYSARRNDPDKAIATVL